MLCVSMVGYYKIIEHGISKQFHLKFIDIFRGINVTEKLTWVSQVTYAEAQRCMMLLLSRCAMWHTSLLPKTGKTYPNTHLFHTK